MQFSYQNENHYNADYEKNSTTQNTLILSKHCQKHRPYHLGHLCQSWSMEMKLFVFIFVMLTLMHSLPAAAFAAEAAVHDDYDNNSKALPAVAATAAAGLKTGMQRMRSPKIAHIHVLQAVAESLTHNENAESKSENKPAPPSASARSGKYEIRSVSGEPNYKSVNLTWEVEFVSSPQDIVTNTSDEIEPPKSFQLYFCELQSFGPHRCRSKIVNGSASSQYDNNNDNDLDVVEQIRRIRQYAAQVENLRMATKYSFHIRSVPKRKQLKITGRSEAFENEIEGGDDFLSNNNLGGQTIVIPTKGFSAQATQCLPNASEIEVETGPNFGGKIVVDGGSCGIKGNPNDTKDKYTMRIDHKACGSMVKPETNTVETFITVQENLGIFTHSTRRFVVVCSYQSGLQTVRASFSVPGRGGASAVAQPQESLEEDERMGRRLRPYRYVDKSELILKEDGGDAVEEEPANASSEETQALVQEMENPSTLLANQSNSKASSTNTNSKREDHSTNDDDADTINSVAMLENIIPGVNEDEIKAKDHQAMLSSSSKKPKQSNEEVKQHEKMVENENHEADDDNDEVTGGGDGMERFSAKFAKLILERNDRNHHYVDDDDNAGGNDDGIGAAAAHGIGSSVYVNDGQTLMGAESTPTGRAFGSTLELFTTSMGSVLLTVLLSVILIGVFILILFRETQRPRVREIRPGTTTPVATLPRHQHLMETHTLPRTLRTKHQDMLA